MLNIKPKTIRIAGTSISKWVFFSLLTIILYGLMGVVAKFASNTVSPLLVQVISSFGMSPLLIILFLSSKSTKNEVKGNLKKGVFFSVMVGVLSVIAALAQFFAYSKGGPASIVVPVISLASLVTVILARYAFKDKLNRYQLIGVLLSIVAILLFNQTGSDGQDLSGPWWKTIRSSWMLFSLLGLFAAGTAQLFIKSSTNHVSSDLVTIIVLSVTLMMTVLFIFSPSFSWQMTYKDLIACILVGILGSGAFFTQSIAYSSGKASTVAPLCSLYPVVTVIMSALFLGEKFTAVIFIALIISSLAGMALSIERKPE